MSEKIEIIYLEPPASAQFVHGQAVTSAQYLQFQNEDALLPNSFDQIMKNNRIISPTRLEYSDPFGHTVNDNSVA